MVQFPPFRLPATPVSRTFGGSRQFRRLCQAWVACAALAGPAEAVTLDELLADRQMNAKRFAAHFEKFEYEFSAPVQPAEVFLANRRGDCDDYAILGDYVLNRHNFGTRLIRINLVGRVAHGVCYVTEAKAYLDFNNRRYIRTLQRSGATIREIATEVAKAFESNWTSASEYTYDYGEDKKRFVATVLKTDPPSRDPLPGQGRPLGHKDPAPEPSDGRTAAVSLALPASSRSRSPA